MAPFCHYKVAICFWLNWKMIFIQLPTNVKYCCKLIPILPILFPEAENCWSSCDPRVWHCRRPRCRSCVADVWSSPSATPRDSRNSRVIVHITFHSNPKWLVFIYRNKFWKINKSWDYLISNVNVILESERKLSSSKKGFVDMAGSQPPAVRLVREQPLVVDGQ